MPTGTGAPELVRYWGLPEPAPRAPVGQTRPSCERELVAHLEEAVRLRMICRRAAWRVPFRRDRFVRGRRDDGAGRRRPGQDLLDRLCRQHYDETRYARMVAERYGTDHEELIVEPDAVAMLPRLVWHYGEPFADPSAMPTYYVSEMARREVTVALNGDGGDEAFLGYRRYQAMRYLARLDRMPQAGRLGLAR